MLLRGSLRRRGEPPSWRGSLRRHRGPSAATPLLVATLQVVARACHAVELQQLELSCCPSMSSSSFSAVVGNIRILLSSEVAALAGHIGGCQSHTEVGLWVFGEMLNVDAVKSTILGLSILLITGVVTWKECLAEAVSCDTLTWFAALIVMAGYLNRLCLISWFSQSVVKMDLLMRGT